MASAPESLSAAENMQTTEWDISARSRQLLYANKPSSTVEFISSEVGCMLWIINLEVRVGCVQRSNWLNNFIGYILH